MTRRCSHCSNNGHNSRTCPTRGGAGGGSSGGGGGGGGGGLGGGGVKLFGVRLTDGSFIKKSASMGNLMHYHSAAAAASVSPSPGSPSDPPQDPAAPLPDGYLSDDPNHASCSSNRRAERKKGTPWTADEHRLFLLGLQKLGKGDWRGISRNFVVSRTPTQVASHAQKYFIRQSNASRRKRRSSLFDMIPDMDTDPQSVPEDESLPPTSPPAAEPTTTNANSLPSLDLSLGTEVAEPEPEPMETTSSEQAEEEPFGEAQVAALPEDLQQPVLPALFPAFIPYPFPYWPPNIAQTENNLHTSNHIVLKPTPVIPKEPVNVDELVGMSKLKLSEAETGQHASPQLSLNLLGGAPSRQSAFHASTAATFNSTDLTEGKSSIIKAV